MSRCVVPQRFDKQRNDAANCDATSWTRYGSPAFFPPEIANGSALVSGTRADVWAAGVSLYFMICGRTPFSAASLEVLLNTICDAKYELPPFIPVRYAFGAVVGGFCFSCFAYWCRSEST